MWRRTRWWPRVGLAAIRDIAAFLRNAETDDKGTPNPLAGDVQYVYSFCSSQPCRTMHDFVLLGFNQPERAAGAVPKAFDGILNWKAGGSGLFINYRFSQPVRTHRQHIARWTPEYQFPFADVKVTDSVTGKTDYRLRRCEESNTCPKTFEANSSNEYWAKASSMMQTDSQGRDLDLAASPTCATTCSPACRTAPATAPASARSRAIRCAPMRPCGRCSPTSTPG